jgi:hypothetical protein
MTKSYFLKNFNSCSEYHKKYKNKQLVDIVKQNINLAPQGSIEWLQSRMSIIGGSEMSIITGENKYSKIENLVASKLIMSEFHGNIATRWGNIFENVTNDLMKIIFNIDDIYETGSLPGSIPQQRYSPDGLALVKLLCVDSPDDDELIETYQICLVIFEYKSPFSVIPNKKIPVHYLPQVKAGLCAIPNADIAIFVNNMFRKCSIDDFNFTDKYNTLFHKTDSKKNINITNPIAMGMIVFYQDEYQKEKMIQLYDINDDTKEEKNKSNSDSDSDSDCDSVVYDSSSDSDSDKGNNHSSDNYSGDSDTLSKIFKKKKQPNNNIADYDMILINKIKKLYKKPMKNDFKSIFDLGKFGYYDFDLILSLFDKKLLHVHYVEPCVFEDQYNNINFLVDQNIYNKSIIIPIAKKEKRIKKQINNVHNFLLDCDRYENNEKYCIGYLPWKLFKSDIITQKRELNYVKTHEKKINDTFSIINDIKDDDPQVMIKKYLSYFPDKRVIIEDYILKNTSRKNDVLEMLD